MLKDVQGYEGLYAVTDCGQVFSYVSGRYLKPATFKSGYMVVCLRKKNYYQITKYVHRLIAETFLEADDKRNEVDHIDGDKTNNNINNLRWASRSENMQNKRTTKGYYWNKQEGKWYAKITANKKTIYLGFYDTEEDARQAYLNAKKIHHPSAPDME